MDTGGPDFPHLGQCLDLGRVGEVYIQTERDDRRDDEEEGGC